MLSSKGFPSKLRAAPGAGGSASDAAAADKEAERKREEEARMSMLNLGFAWTLVAACCLHHLGHFFHVL